MRHGWIAIALVLGCGNKKEADKTASPEPTAAKPSTPEPPAKPPAIDPGKFAELDTSAWPVTKLSSAGVALRLPDGVKVSEAGKLSSEPVGPYIGLVLASGYDLQIDSSGGSLEESIAIAKEQEVAGKEKILLAGADALVRQPAGSDRCYVRVCKQTGASLLCGSAGKRVIMSDQGNTEKWPTLGDCSALLAIVRSIEPL